jgi:hypothetical protein
VERFVPVTGSLYDPIRRMRRDVAAAGVGALRTTAAGREHVR